MTNPISSNASFAEELKDDFQQMLNLLTSPEEISFNKVSSILSRPNVQGWINLPMLGLRVRFLHLACWRQEDVPKIVELLLKNGANLELTDKLGRTALHYSCDRGHVKTTEFLLKAGCDPNIAQKVNLSDSDNDGYSTVKLSATSNQVKLPITECWGRTALHLAVKGGHVKCCQILLKYNALTNIEDERNQTPLQLAGTGISSSDLEGVSQYELIVSMLIAANTQVDVESRLEKNCVTPLHTAVRLRSLEIVKALLQAGAPLKGLILHEAAEAGNLEIMECLLHRPEANNFINSRNFAGCTPLHVAAYYGLPAIIHLLISHGGNLAALTDSYLSVVDLIQIHVARPDQLFLKILDEALEMAEGECTGPEFGRHCKIITDFACLTPESSQHQMAVTRALLESCSQQQQVTLLEHPVLQGFLRLKWFRLRKFFIALTLLHIVHVISLSTFVIMLRVNKFTATQVSWPGRILLICSTCLAINCLFQTGVQPRQAFRDFETWIGLLNSALGLLIGISGETAGEVPDWLIHVMSGAVLLAWTHIMLITGRFALWGFYALMFYSVLVNVLKVLFTFCFLVFGFALCFALEYHQVKAFSDPGRSLVKTVAMVMGEFEYNEIFTEDGKVEGIIPRILFLLFVVLATIVLANLMIGLAVNDIQWIQTLGSTSRLDKQSNFVFQLERLASHRFLKSTFVPNVILRLINETINIPTLLEIYPGRGKSGMAGLSSKQIDKIVTIALRNHREKHGGVRHPGIAPCSMLPEQEAFDILTILRDLQQQINELNEALEWQMNATNFVNINSQSSNRFLTMKINRSNSAKKLHMKPSQSTSTFKKLTARRKASIV